MCLSCRAFFVRANKGENFKNFECANQNLDLTKCQLNSKSYKSCKLCRFNRCVEVGMSLPGKDKIKDKKNKTVVLVATPEERSQYRAKIVQHFRKARHSKIWESMLANTMLTFEDMGAIEGFPNLQEDFSHKVIPNLVHHNLNLLKGIFRVMYHHDKSDRKRGG